MNNGTTIHIILIVITLLLSKSVCRVALDISLDEMAYQKWWIACTTLLFAIVVGLIIILRKYVKSISFIEFSKTVTFSMILLAGLEAISGLRQIYGFTSSNHSLYGLTGSFYNPGPYSGYLAMVFPLSLHEWLKWRKETNRNRIQSVAYYFSLLVLLLIFCVLPAGMSRSAWLAAIISGVWVYGMQDSWREGMRKRWREHRNRFLIGISVAVLYLFLLGVFLFYLKKDSANGRLFRVC